MDRRNSQYSIISASGRRRSISVDDRGHRWSILPTVQLNNYPSNGKTEDWIIGPSASPQLARMKAIRRRRKSDELREGNAGASSAGSSTRPAFYHIAPNAASSSFQSTPSPRYEQLEVSPFGAAQTVQIEPLKIRGRKASNASISQPSPRSSWPKSIQAPPPRPARRSVSSDSPKQLYHPNSLIPGSYPQAGTGMFAPNSWHSLSSIPPLTPPLTPPATQTIIPETKLTRPGLAPIITSFSAPRSRPLPIPPVLMPSSRPRPQPIIPVLPVIPALPPIAFTLSPAAFQGDSTALISPLAVSRRSIAPPKVSYPVPEKQFSNDRLPVALPRVDTYVPPRDTYISSLPPGVNDKAIVKPTVAPKLEAVQIVHEEPVTPVQVVSPQPLSVISKPDPQFCTDLKIALDVLRRHDSISTIASTPDSSLSALTDTHRRRYPHRQPTGLSTASYTYSDESYSEPSSPSSSSEEFPLSTPWSLGVSEVSLATEAQPWSAPLKITLGDSVNRRPSARRARTAELTINGVSADKAVDWTVVRTVLDSAALSRRNSRPKASTNDYGYAKVWSVFSASSLRDRYVPHAKINPA